MFYNVGINNDEKKLPLFDLIKMHIVRTKTDMGACVRVYFMLNYV